MQESVLVSEKRQTTEEMQEVFRLFAASEGGRIPVYATICRAIADDPELAAILLEAPRGQRLPVLLLAALHDVVLRRPECPLAPWFPSASALSAASVEDPTEALHDTVDDYRADILDLVRRRQVQTNEVNRCTGWMLALSELCQDDRRHIALVEVGASAGLNLRLDDYAYTISRDGDEDIALGRADSSVRLGTELRAGRWPGLETAIPRVTYRIGLDQRPVNVLEADDDRWLRACVWPEQRVRFERLEAALDAARLDPVPVIVGDLVDDLASVVSTLPTGAHVVVLVSWVLAYVRRERRERFGDALTEMSRIVDQPRREVEPPQPGSAVGRAMGGRTCGPRRRRCRHGQRHDPGGDQLRVGSPGGRGARSLPGPPRLDGPPRLTGPDRPSQSDANRVSRSAASSAPMNRLNCSKVASSSMNGIEVPSSNRRR